MFPAVFFADRGQSTSAKFNSPLGALRCVPSGAAEAREDDLHSKFTIPPHLTLARGSIGAFSVTGMPWGFVVRTGNMRRGRRALIASAVAVVALAGCGGEGGGSRAEDVKEVEAVATSATPKPAVTLTLVDDEESAEASPLTIAVLANDTATEAAGGGQKPLTSFLGGSEYELTLDSQPGHGTAVVDGVSIIYTPVTGYSGEDEFTYRVKPNSPDVTGGTAVVRITVDAPVPSPTPTPTPKPKPTRTQKAEPPAVYYRNCDAARAAGAAPVRRGDPGYASHLDRDGDGVGCEPYSGGSGGSGASVTGGSSSGGSGSTYYENCSAARAAGAAPVRRGDPGYGRHLDRDGDDVGCES
ncbi:excalibur calcium-binding domain-containing protein [Streptomyces sp. NPDC059567]|uniref:excalibur calcium-binding domain-containing protein n=1 Tax=Streptomyces sp. NPDC059567 TaxID=3346867 RepID=UPI0036785D7F